MNSLINASVLEEIIDATAQKPNLQAYNIPRFKILLRIHLQCHCLAWAWEYFKNIYSKCQFCEFSLSPENPDNTYCIQLELQNHRWTLLSVALVMEWHGISDNMSYFLMRMHLEQPRSQQCKEPSQLLPNWNNLDKCFHLMKITRT